MTIINIQINKALEDINKINILSEKTDRAITAMMENSYKQSYRIFWSNPVDICNEAGNQAYLLFQKHVEMGQKIKERDENFVELKIPEGWSIDFNKDGSVNCVYKEIILPIDENIV